MSLSSYPSIYTSGHRVIADMFKTPVVVQEKVDGSQFSMSRVNGELFCRSRGQQIVIDAPNDMFKKAVEVAKSLPLRDGWIYRGEYLAKPKHNTLAYARVPANHIVLFDVMTAPDTYLDTGSLQLEADRLGLETAPLLYKGLIHDMEHLQSFMDRESFLGGCKIEGVVAKNYNIVTQEKTIAICKLVSEAFKEKHQGEWRKSNPTPADVVERIIAEFKTEARWNKAIQHLREAGQLADDPTDIGKLMKEVPTDVLKECAEEIKERLWKYAWPNISRGVVRGLPEYYKAKLAETQQFSE